MTNYDHLWSNYHMTLCNNWLEIFSDFCGWKNKTPLIQKTVTCYDDFLEKQNPPYSKNCHTLRRLPGTDRYAFSRGGNDTTFNQKWQLELQEFFETVILGRLSCTCSPQFCRMSSEVLGPLRQNEVTSSDGGWLAYPKGQRSDVGRLEILSGSQQRPMGRLQFDDKTYSIPYSLSKLYLVRNTTCFACLYFYFVVSSRITFIDAVDCRIGHATRRPPGQNRR